MNCSLAKAPTPEGILEVARDADAVLTTYAKVTTEVVGQLTKCRIISRFGIGVDNVDIATATRKGIVVTKVPDYCIDEVSDHAMALLLAMVRKIPFANAACRPDEWKMPSVVPIHRLRGTSLGLVGFGRIPQLVAPKAQAFGFRVDRLRSLRAERSHGRGGSGASGIRRAGKDLRRHFHSLLRSRRKPSPL